MSEKIPVDRARRHKFALSITLICLVTAAALAFLVGGTWLIATPIVDVYISAAMSLAMAVSLAYISGSVIDYNGGISSVVGNLFKASPDTKTVEAKTSSVESKTTTTSSTATGAKG